MSLRQRIWKTRNGAIRTAWIVDYRHESGQRRMKTFADKTEARKFHALKQRRRKPLPFAVDENDMRRIAENVLILQKEVRDLRNRLRRLSRVIATLIRD